MCGLPPPARPGVAARVSFGGAVLAGGASRRMGADKAFIELDGSTLLDRAVMAVADGGADPVVVVGGDRERIEAAGHRYAADQHPGEGPLGGIITALDVVDRDLVVVLACDLIEASPVAVSSLVAVAGSADVAVPVVDGRGQWLHAVWRRTTLEPLRAAFAAGERAPRRALAGLDVVELLDGSPGWYADADRPTDLPDAAKVTGPEHGGR